MDKNVIIQVWKDWLWKSQWNEIINQGYTVLLSACWYINYIEYGETWRKYYECDPIATTGVPQSQWSQILGGEAAIWGEYVDQTNIVPRLFPFTGAVASVLWDSNIGDGSGRENTDDAMHRLDAFRCNLLRRGVRAQPIINSYCGPFELTVELK
ncbi:unnamed protein product [Allacma fusca]|uniref:Glycoside hydrolase family 20 catalytic domain-containing protein n=1 Tax=Allacma fusca TaxID=39272 RepID=A0A8J2NT09_9HEXA|nr:unnamed protein product [Allacma fusca]